MKTIISKIIFAVIFFVSITNYGQEKLDLKVLYVGYQPGKLMPENLSATAVGYLSKSRFKAEYKTRYPAFMNYLNTTFSSVKGVDAREYKPEMSADYDVTIFDEVTNPISKAKVETNKEGQRIGYTPAKYLEDNFNHAAIFIGHVASTMTEPVGSKFNWLCLCLDADAHHINTEHPIFSTPLKVDLTFETKPTPSGAFHYPTGVNLPKELPMWRVQIEGYLEGKGYRIGLVSTGGSSFLDSPDAEYISSGVNTKDVEAVAIGRHGNFMLWGFSASPDYMTEEAKKVFANTVVYMKQYKGQGIIARRDNPRIQPRTTVAKIKYNLTQEAYQDYLSRIKKFQEDDEKNRLAAIAKKERGEKLTDDEAESAGRPSRPTRPDMPWNSYVKRYTRGYSEQFGTDVDAYVKYLEDNIEYLGYFKDEGRKEFGYAGLFVDKDVKSLGVSNRKLELLETCINLLNKEEKKELAKRILVRYTNENFETPSEWENWYTTHKDKLFFTEGGGYKWLVNTL